MVELVDIISYILKYYPHKKELSNARLTKMIYLIDWRSAFDCGKTVTDIHWYFDNYGPFVHDIEETINDNLNIIQPIYTNTIYGTKKKLFILKNDNIHLENIPQNVQNMIDIIIEKTKGLYWQQFINFVYSTYPIVTSERYTYLNLVQKAIQYKQELSEEGY